MNNKMNICIIGASHGLGLTTIKRALERGHKVTTLSRSKINIALEKEVKSIYGSALNKKNVIKTIEGSDSVIVTLGNNKFSGTTLFSDFANILVQINPQVPCIIVTGFGAGGSWEYNNFFMKLFFKILLKKIYEDKTKMEKIISHSSLKWTIVRPGLLTNSSLTENYKVEKNLFKGMNIGKISRYDVSDFLIKESENQKYLHLYPALSFK